MKPEHRIYLVDVFTRNQYSGNPLAVIVSEQPLAAATGLQPQDIDTLTPVQGVSSFEAHAVRENPATGNGAAFPGAYLLEHATGNKRELNLRIEQGHELGRPSLIYIHARQLDTGPEIKVGGTVVANVAGRLLGPDYAD